MCSLMFINSCAHYTPKNETNIKKVDYNFIIGQPRDFGEELHYARLKSRFDEFKRVILEYGIRDDSQSQYDVFLTIEYPIYSKSLYKDSKGLHFLSLGGLTLLGIPYDKILAEVNIIAQVKNKRGLLIDTIEVNAIGTEYVACYYGYREREAQLIAREKAIRNAMDILIEKLNNLSQNIKEKEKNAVKEQKEKIHQEVLKKKLKEAQMAREKKENPLKFLMKNISKKVDEFDDRIIYQSYNSKQGYKDKCFLRLAYYPKEKRCLMFWNIVYYSNDWLFIENFTVKADDKKYNVYLSYGDVSRDNDAGSIWESVSLPYNQYKETIKAIANAKQVTIRFYGNKYYADRKLSQANINAMKDMLFLYDFCQKGILENK